MHFGEERIDIYCSYVLVLRLGSVSDIQVHIVIIDLCLLNYTYSIHRSLQITLQLYSTKGVYGISSSFCFL